MTFYLIHVLAPTERQPEHGTLLRCGRLIERPKQFPTLLITEDPHEATCTTCRRSLGLWDQ